METYIYKMIALSAVFILLYFVFLEKEKNHHFKRLYLLLSVLFSIFIPLISITYGEIKVEEQALVNHQEIIILPETKLAELSVFTIWNILFGIYFLGFIILLLKFSVGIFKLIKEIKTSEKVKQDNITFILKQNKITPYSFWSYIFLNKKDFLEGKIDAKIILHEKAHINQKHSIDVLFIEILLCVFWFNPVFYFYKKAMITNHEFLADEEVLKQNHEVENYQKLILNELISEKILFTHPFNLNNTKKRIVMMTTKITKIAKLKSYLTLPISATLFFAFVEKVPAKVEMNDERKSAFIKEKNQEILHAMQLKNDTISPKKKEENKTEKFFKKQVNKLQKTIKNRQEINQSSPPILTPAQFPGGMNALRQKFAENIDTNNFSEKGTLKGIIWFNVQPDGKTADVFYEFDNKTFQSKAQEAIEKSLKGVTWKPGTLNGKPVASQLKLPITMNFE